MVLAAGLGLRMRPLTNTLPKPLIPVAGKTMLERAFEHLKQVGMTRIVINTHYLASLVEERAKSLWPDVLISHEKDLLETGGGIQKALPLLGEEPFFTLNGDSIWTHPESLQEMEKLWDDAEMDALLLLIPKERAHGYEGRGDFFLSADGRIFRPDSESSAPYVYIGVQRVSPRLFHKAPEGAFSMNLLWNKALQQGRLYGHLHKGEWFHISTPQDLKKYEPMIEKISLFSQGVALYR